MFGNHKIKNQNWASDLVDNKKTAFGIMSMMRNCKLNSQIAVKISVMRKKSGQFCECVTRSHLNVPRTHKHISRQNIDPTLRIIDLYQQT